MLLTKVRDADLETLVVEGLGLIEAVGCMEQRGEVVAVSGDVGVVRSEAVLDEGGPDVCRARS